MGVLHTDRFWRRYTERIGATRDITLTGALVLTERDVLDSEVLNLDANGAARNVDLPATSQTLRGQQLVINNTAAGAFSLTVRLTGGGATVVVVAQNKMGLLLCWGAAAGSWRGLTA
jgi:hypothetical protein